MVKYPPATMVDVRDEKKSSFWDHEMAGWWCNNHLEKYESQWEGLSHI
jgi:hypothetical protein